MFILDIKSYTVFGLLGILLLQSCKKEYARYPYNDIEQFIVTDADGNKLKAVIGDDNSILLYWTPFQSVPDSVAPLITISDRANISPASGKKIAFKEGVVYTVTAQDGTKKNYLFKPAINTPEPVFSVDTYRPLTLGGILIINGEFFIPDTARTKLYLVDKSNKETQLHDFDEFYSTTIHTTIPLTGLDTGYYSIKLVSGSNSVISVPQYVGLPGPFAGNTSYSFNFNNAGETLAKGSEISFNYTASGPLAQVTLPRLRVVLLTSGDEFAEQYNGEFVSLSPTTVKFRLPNNMPGGMIVLFIIVDSELLYQFEGDPATFVED